MIEVKRRAQTHGDRAGDPLDGLVNMFDVGIVLAVAFLIAALQSHDLTSILRQTPAAKPTPAPRASATPDKTKTIVVKPDQKLEHIKAGSTHVSVKSGGSLGQVYQLPNGQLVFVAKKKR